MTMPSLKWSAYNYITIDDYLRTASYHISWVILSWGLHDTLLSGVPSGWVLEW